MAFQINKNICEKSQRMNQIFGNTFHTIKSLVLSGSNVDEKGENLETPLFWLYHDPRTIKFLIENGADVNHKNEDNETPLFKACNNLETVKLLVENGADVNHENDYKETPLFKACYDYNNREIMEFLIENGADLNHKDSDGFNLIVYALNDHLTVRYLIQKGIDVRVETKDGGPLFWTSSEANFKYLLENGADINSVNRYGETVIFRRYLLSNLNLLKLALEHHTNINHEDENKKTVLFKAKSVSAIEFLLENGADIEHEDKNKNTPLFNACNDLNITTVFVENGANVNHKNHEGETPLIRACLNKNIDVVKYLLEHQANPNDISSGLLIQICLSNDDIDIIKLLIDYGAVINRQLTREIELYENMSFDKIRFLLEHGANVDFKGHKERTLMHYATKLDNLKLVNLLIMHGANVNLKRFNGKTPIFNACKTKSIEMVQLLLDNGANVNAKKYEQSLFQFACLKSNFEIVKLLASYGANVHYFDYCRNTCLFFACKNLNIVKYLVEEKGLSVHHSNYWNQTCLFKAAKFGNTDVIEYLIQNGLNVNHEDDHKNTPLFFSRDKSENIKCLLEHGADIHHLNLDNETFLFNFDHNDIKSLNFLIDYLGDNKEMFLNQKNYQKMTVLKLLKLSNCRINQEFIKILEENGAV